MFRGNFIEQNVYDHAVRGALLLQNCLGVDVHRALNGRMPQQFLLHLDVSAFTSEHR